MSRNIDLFDAYAAAILADLYEAFPVKIPLDATKYCGHGDIDEFGVPVDPNGNPSKAFDVAKSTIEWLMETGYIRGEGFWQYGAKPSVLTPMGLAVLKAVPESLNVKETTGDKLVRLTGAGASDAAKEVIRTTLATGAALLSSQVG